MNAYELLVERLKKAMLDADGAEVTARNARARVEDLKFAVAVADAGGPVKLEMPQYV